MTVPYLRASLISASLISVPYLPLISWNRFGPLADRINGNWGWVLLGGGGIGCVLAWLLKRAVRYALAHRR